MADFDYNNVKFTTKETNNKTLVIVEYITESTKLKLEFTITNNNPSTTQPLSKSQQKLIDIANLIDIPF